MGNSDNKSNFITQLFLYYKPVLTKEKQIQLLMDWSSSCLEKEEYEMASTLKTLLYNVEHDIDIEDDDSSIIIVPNNVELVYDGDFIDGKLPKIVTKDKEVVEEPVEKTKKGLRWVNIWEEKYGFTLIECRFSIKKREFRLILLNYGVDYS